jgi:hypothetical protein
MSKNETTLDPKDFQYITPFCCGTARATTSSWTYLSEPQEKLWDLSLEYCKLENDQLPKPLQKKALNTSVKDNDQLNESHQSEQILVEGSSRPAFSPSMFQEGFSRLGMCPLCFCWC